MSQQPSTSWVKTFVEHYLTIGFNILFKVISRAILTISAYFYLYSQYETRKANNNKFTDDYKTAATLFLSGTILQIISHVFIVYIQQSHTKKIFPDLPTKSDQVSSRSRSSPQTQETRPDKVTNRTRRAERAKQQAAISIHKYLTTIHSISFILMLVGINIYLYAESQTRGSDDYATAWKLSLAGTVGYSVHLLFNLLRIHNIVAKGGTTPAVVELISLAI